MALFGCGGGNASSSSTASFSSGAVSDASSTSSSASAPVSSSSSASSPSSAAANAPGDSSAFAGTWTLYEVAGEGETAASHEELKEIGATNTLTLAGDGTGTLVRNDESQQITWQQADDATCTITDGDGEHTATLADGKLTVETGGANVFVYKK